MQAPSDIPHQISKAHILLRGLTKRCPRCGERKIFQGWTEMVEACPRCGLVFEREEGYWVGAVAINTVVTLFGFGFIVLLVAYLTWPDTPVLILVTAGVVGGIVFPVFFYPFSKTVWLAMDLAFFNPQFMQPGTGLHKSR